MPWTAGPDAPDHDDAFGISPECGAVDAGGPGGGRSKLDRACTSRLRNHTGPDLLRKRHTHSYRGAHS